MSCHPVLEYDDGSHQILEVDESQHFNEYRALTLRAYVNLPVAFDREAWLTACQRKTRLEGHAARTASALERRDLRLLLLVQSGRAA